MTAPVELTRRILLFETHVATLDFSEQAELVCLSVGHRLAVEHRPRPTEPCLVALVDESTVVGWLPGSDSEMPARLLMAGKQLEADVVDLDTYGRRLAVRVALYLVEPLSPPRAEPAREGLPAQQSVASLSPTSPAAARSAAHEGGLPSREARGVTLTGVTLTGEAHE